MPVSPNTLHSLGGSSTTSDGMDNPRLGGA